MDDDRIRSSWQDANHPDAFLQELKHFISKSDLDYVSFINAGDDFSTDYLQILHRNIGEASPAAIYTDEDRYLSPHGRLGKPFLKPDPSLMLLYSTNYLQNAFFNNSLVTQLPNDLDSPANLVQQLCWDALHGPQQVLHVPGLLFHCAYQHPGEEADRDLPHLACLKRNLQQQGLRQVRVEAVAGGQAHVSWAVQDALVSIIIPTHNQSARLVRLLDSLRDLTTYPNYEILLLDDHSDETGIAALYDNLSADRRIRILRRDEAFNYSLYNNIGARAASGEILIFLNNDMTITQSEWLTELVMWAQQPGVGIVGARLMYPNNRIQHAGVIMGLVGSAGHVFIGEPPYIQGPYGSPLQYRNLLAVTGACMAISRDMFEHLGGFDEAYRLTFSDIALCLKAIEQGYQVVYNPFAFLVHDEGGTRGDTIPDEDIRRMAVEFTPWVIQGDPYFNPLLSRLVATPALHRSHEEDPLHRMRMIQALAGYPETHHRGRV